MTNRIGTIVVPGPDNLFEIGGSALMTKRHSGAEVVKLTGRSGEMLIADWIHPGGFDSSLLIIGEDGVPEFVRNKDGSALTLYRNRRMFGKGTRPYTVEDPFLDPWSTALAMSRPESGEGSDAGELLMPFVREIFAMLDDGAAKVAIGRSPTFAEYEFLREKPERPQAVAVFPWLLPWIVSGMSSPNDEPAKRVLAAIDAREELIPVLCREFGTEPNVVRSMSAIAAWHPGDYRYSYPAYEKDPAAIASALSRVAPEKRPTGKEDERFLGIMHWACAVLKEGGDTDNREAVAHAAAAVWTKLKKRPYALPDFRELNWLGELQKVATGFPDAPKFYAGELCGKRVELMAGTWAVLWAMSRYHPVDLAAEGRKWMRTEIVAVREAIGNGFESSIGFSSGFPKEIVGKDGLSARLVRTLGELVEHSYEAKNCLSGYLPDLLNGHRAVYGIRDAEGKLVGHFDVVEGEDDVPQTEQVKSLRNRKASPAMARLAKLAVSEIAALVRASYATPFCPENEAAKKEARQAEHVISMNTYFSHDPYAREAMEKAVELFGLEKA